MRIFYRGFNFSQDGPGNRLVFHLQGCNMRCPWCSNPEGMVQDGGKEYSTEELVSEALRCRPMFFSGGGVTFTGGEATLQTRELEVVLRSLRGEGIHTAIETNGTSSELMGLQEHIDYLIMDFKHFDDFALRSVTGVGNRVLKRNFESLCALGRQLHVRIPLINGFNAHAPQGFAEYFSRFDTSGVAFEFLPYHEYGRAKWKEEYRVKNGFVTAATVSEFRRIFEENELKVIST